MTVIGRGQERPSTRPGLQIARLAVDGLSNREIGQQLYLSHRAGRTHLDKIFPKLEITSRGQPHATLAATGFLD